MLQHDEVQAAGDLCIINKISTTSLLANDYSCIPESPQQRSKRLFYQPWIFGLLLLIYSFEFTSAFQPQCYSWLSLTPLSFFNYMTASIAKKGNLTRHLELRTWLSHGQHEPSCQLSASKVISFKSYCADTHMHTQTALITLPWQLK